MVDEGGGEKELDGDDCPECVGEDIGGPVMDPDDKTCRLYRTIFVATSLVES